MIFLHEVVEGTADRSYGIQVARLAGLPDAVVSRAKDVLAQLERQNEDKSGSALIDDLPLFSATPRKQTAPAAQHGSALREALGAINPDDLTPREALDALYQLKAQAVDMS